MDKNIIGDNGERLTAIRLSQDELFRIILLGEKIPAFDLLCEINDDAHPYQFLLQVKATDSSNPFTVKKPLRIKTPVPSANYSSLVSRPLPTYVAGVDLKNEDVYVAAAFGSQNHYGGSIPTTYKLSKNDLATSRVNLQMMKDDVINYWQQIGIDDHKAQYNSSLI